MRTLRYWGKYPLCVPKRINMKRRTFLKGLLFAALIPKFLIPKEEIVPVIDKFEPLDNNYKVGYKGKSSFEAGFIYCPYIPLQLLKTKES